MILNRPNCHGGFHAMPARHFRFVCLIVFSIALFGVAPCFAQAPIEPAHLPKHTTFYVLWRGTPPAEVRKNNALLSLWDDPDFSPIRATLFNAMNNSEKKKGQEPLTREALSEYAPLLDNSFVIGYLAKPELTAAPAATAKAAATKTPATRTSAAKKTATAPEWKGMFFVYDRSGKEALLSKAVTHMRSEETDIPKLLPVTVGGVSALKIQRKSGVTYWAETGKYAVSANELSVFEEILKRLNAKPVSTSLADTEEFQEARPLLGNGILEFFLRIPDAKTLSASAGTSASAMQAKALLSLVKFDAIHAVAGHLSLESTKTRLQGAILGDAAPGTLFDIWSEGQENPAALSLVSANTVYLNETQFDLIGIYNLLKRTFAQGQPQLIDSVEKGLETRLGMPLKDALALTNGEISSLQNDPALDDSKRIFALSIRNKPDTMKLLRSIFGDQLSAEHTEGATTTMKISAGGGQSNAGVAQFNFYYLALTSDLLIASAKNAALQDLLAWRAAPAATPTNIAAARAQFPGKISGFSYIDFQKIDWPALKAKWAAEAKAATAKSSPPDSTSNPSDFLNGIDPTVFSRHLHSLQGASWKDSKGIHFDEWIN
jgi:hypothetical protein